jgi:hypothetical protein
MTRGNTAPHTMSSEHTNQTQIAADNNAAAPSGRETNSNLCRKRKNFNNNNNTERSTTEFRRVRQPPSPPPQDLVDTSRTQGQKRRPDLEASRAPRAALPQASDSRKRPMDEEADQTPEEESPPRKKRQRGSRRRRRQTFTQRHLDFRSVISTALWRRD